MHYLVIISINIIIYIIIIIYHNKDGNSLINLILPKIDGTLGKTETESLLSVNQTLNVSKWNSFDSELLDFFNRKEIKEKLKKNYNNLQFSETEITFQSHGNTSSWLHHRILLDIFKHRFFEHDNDIEFDFEPNGLTCKPDIVYKKKNDKKIIYFTIEVKCDFNLLNNQTFISSYNENRKQQIKHNVHQLYYYMTETNTKYGLLSSVEKSYFFKNENDKLYISDEINQTNLVRSLFFMLTISKEAYDPKSPPSNAEFNHPKEQPNSLQTIIVNYVLNISPTAPIIGFGRSGCVFKAQFSTKQVAVKITDMYKCSSNLFSELDNEVNIYKFLNSKNVTCVPFLIWNGIYKIFKTTITDYVEGQHIEFFEMTIEQKKACINSLQLLHNVNCLHRDLRSENFIIRKTSTGFEEAVIIDYGFSTLNNTKDLLENEMQELKSLLSFNDSFKSINSIIRTIID